jgi:hypothetical protein
VDDFGSVNVPQSIGLDWDSDGNLYVSSYNGKFVQKFDTQGNDLGLFIDNGLAGPTNIWFEDSGDLLVIDYNGTTVKKYDSEGNFKSDFMTGLSQAEGVAYLNNGNIIVGNGKTNSVKQFSSDGSYINNIIPDGLGGLQTPNAVVIHETASSTKDIPASFSFEVNPTLGTQFDILLDPEIQDSVDCFIYDMKGTLIDHLKGKIALHWNATNVPVGTYQIQLVIGERKGMKQVIVK